MARRKEVLSLGWLASQGHDCSGGDVADMHRDNDVESEEHCEEIVVAVGGLGGRIELVGLQVCFSWATLTCLLRIVRSSAP